MSAPEFVAVGHATLDHIEGAVRPGGAAVFAAVTAARLGLSTGVLTSHAEDFPLDRLPPRIEVVSLPARDTTVFEHRRKREGRELRAGPVAAPLGPSDVPEDWRGASLVLLAPVLGEVDPMIVTAFDEATVGASVQGWLRDPAGAVLQPRGWMPPPPLLGRLQALFVSTEDARGLDAYVQQWVQRVPIVVVTAGKDGAVLFVSGERYQVRPRRAREVDATGAGDVFAATFMIEYDRTGDAWDAAEAASCAASLSVEGEGWATVPDRAALEVALAAHARRAPGLP